MNKNEFSQLRENYCFPCWNIVLIIWCSRPARFYLEVTLLLCFCFHHDKTVMHVMKMQTQAVLFLSTTVWAVSPQHCSCSPHLRRPGSVCQTGSWRARGLKAHPWSPGLVILHSCSPAPVFMFMVFTIKPIRLHVAKEVSKWKWMMEGENGNQGKEEGWTFQGGFRGGAVL